MTVAPPNGLIGVAVLLNAVASPSAVPAARTLSDEAMANGDDNGDTDDDDENVLNDDDTSGLVSSVVSEMLANTPCAGGDDDLIETPPNKDVIQSTASAKDLRSSSDNTLCVVSADMINFIHEFVVTMWRVGSSSRTCHGETRHDENYLYTIGVNRRCRGDDAGGIRHGRVFGVVDTVVFLCRMSARSAELLDSRVRARRTVLLILVFAVNWERRRIAMLLL